jgi:hypothetical protein
MTEVKESQPDAAPSLDKQFNELFEWHQSLAGRVYYYECLHGHLISEFHHKKFVLQTKGKKQYKAQDPDTEKAYHHLFFGRRQCTNLDPWPCQFKGNLDSVACMQLRGDEWKVSPGLQSQVLDIYYNGRRKSGLHPFNPKEWQLDKDAKITPTDRVVLQRYHIQFVDFLDELIDIVDRHPIESSYDTKKQQRRDHKRTLAALRSERRRINDHLWKMTTVC